MDQKIISKLRDYFSNQPVQKAWVFGSFSREEATPESDIDILVSFDDTVGLFKYASMVSDLEELLHKAVDLVSDTSLLPWGAPTVNNDKILIYERETA